MAGGYRTPPPDDLGALVAELERIRVRLSELEIPTGTSVNSLVAQVQAAIADITTTVTAAITANSYTKTEIDTKIASPGAITPTTVAASGNVSVGGTLGVTGQVTTSGTVQVGGQLRAPDIITFNITGTRRTLWGEDATGRIGYASSSETAKKNIAPAVIDTAAVLSVEPVVFEYIAQHAERERRAALPSPYVDWNPHYPVALEIGFIAERLVDAGLSQFVIFGHDGQPEGIEYSMWVVAQQSVLRWIVGRLDAAGI